MDKPWEIDALNLKASGVSRCPLENASHPEQRLSLPTVTLICVDCVHEGRSTSVIDRCLELCDFGAVKFLTSLPSLYPYTVPIPPLPSLCDYSIFMLKKVHEYVDTPHMLIVQHDGFVLNPDVWDPAWLQYDYIAPLFDQVVMVGSGGFSFRSKRLMSTIASKLPDWDGTPAGTDKLQQFLGCYEDGVISVLMRGHLESIGYRYAPIPEAIKFAQGGGKNSSHFLPRPFGFHRPDPLRTIDYVSGIISGLRAQRVDPA